MNKSCTYESTNELCSFSWKDVIFKLSRNTVYEVWRQAVLATSGPGLIHTLLILIALKIYILIYDPFLRNVLFFARITTSWLLFRKLVAALTFVLSKKTYSVAHKSLAERHPLKGSTIHWKWTMATTYREPFILLPVFDSQVQFYPSPELKNKQYPLLMSVFELNMVEKQTNWYFNKINTAKPLSIWRPKKRENKNIVRNQNK